MANLFDQVDENLEDLELSDMGLSEREIFNLFDDEKLDLNPEPEEKTPFIIRAGRSIIWTVFVLVCLVAVWTMIDDAHIHSSKIQDGDFVVSLEFTDGSSFITSKEVSHIMQSDYDFRLYRNSGVFEEDQLFAQETENNTSSKMRFFNTYNKGVEFPKIELDKWIIDIYDPKAPTDAKVYAKFADHEQEFTVILNQHELWTLKAVILLFALSFWFLLLLFFVYE